MDLPVMPPIKPMLAKATTWPALLAQIERGSVVKLEPKWDGFCPCLPIGWGL